MFADRLVNDEDRTWFSNLLKDKVQNVFKCKMEDVITQEPVLFGDFLTQNMENRPYVEITDHEKVYSGISFWLLIALILKVLNF